METVELIIECSMDDEQEKRIRKLGTIKYSLPMINSYVIEIPKSHLKKIHGISGINSVCDNSIITAQMHETRKVVNAYNNSSFRNAYTGRGITVAILDTGVAPVRDLCHPNNRIIAFKDFINGKTEPYDDNAHGTHVTWLISFHMMRYYDINKRSTFSKEDSIMKKVKERFLNLIAYNTQSDPNSKTCPSTKSQIEFSKILAKECVSIGLSDVITNELGYVYATLPSNSDKKTVTVGFIAHMDTSPDSCGEGVCGVCVGNYDGQDILLDGSKTLSPNEFPHLKRYIGNELIVTKGNTLLGADDKAGIAEILTAMEYLLQNPQIEHGPIRICFTPDEEIGRGADRFDVAYFGADFAFTVDGGEIGELEYESFNAARVKIEITGKSVHPGYATNIMKNAALIAMEISNSFPENETPATTSGREGFYHLTGISGNVERAEMEYIIRDFDKNNFKSRKIFARNAVMSINKKYGESTAKITIHDEYFNMHDILRDKLYIVDLARLAMESVGVKPKIAAIRGGTDGSRLSFMGLPCPNIFAGGHNFHGPYEYVPVESMIKACEVIVKICELAVNVE